MATRHHSGFIVLNFQGARAEGPHGLIPQVFESFEPALNAVWAFVIEQMTEKKYEPGFLSEFIADEEEMIYAYGYGLDLENAGELVGDLWPVIRSYLSKLHNRDRLFVCEWLLQHHGEKTGAGHFSLRHHSSPSGRTGTSIWNHLRNLPLNEVVGHPYLSLFGIEVQQSPHGGYEWISRTGRSKTSFDTMGKAAAEAVQNVERRCIEFASIDMDAWYALAEHERLAICKEAHLIKSAA